MDRRGNRTRPDMDRRGNGTRPDMDRRGNGTRPDMDRRGNRTRPGMDRRGNGTRPDMDRPDDRDRDEDDRDRRPPMFCEELVCGPVEREKCQEFKFEDGRPQRAFCIPEGELNWYPNVRAVTLVCMYSLTN